MPVFLSINSVADLYQAHAVLEALEKLDILKRGDFAPMLHSEIQRLIDDSTFSRHNPLTTEYIANLFQKAKQ